MKLSALVGRSKEDKGDANFKKRRNRKIFIRAFDSQIVAKKSGLQFGRFKIIPIDLIY